MSSLPPKAESVQRDGTPDGFVAPNLWRPERDPRSGGTRIVASFAASEGPRILEAVVAALDAPLGVLWRQIVDRRDPKPQGTPARDRVALELTADRVIAATRAARQLLFHDARGELWLRDRNGAEALLDADGLLFLYPDDPSFRDALTAAGLPMSDTQTVDRRDYVRHNFLASADAEEDALVAALGLVEIAPQKRSGNLY
jgi:hypothetical protein